MYFNTSYPKWLIFFELHLKKFNIFIKNCSFKYNLMKLTLQKQNNTLDIEIKIKDKYSKYYIKTEKFFINFLFLKKLNNSQKKIIYIITKIINKIEIKLPDNFIFPKNDKIKYDNTIKKKLKEKNITEYNPQKDNVLDYKWYYYSSDIKIDCINPWINIEMMDVKYKQMSCCNPNWLKNPFTSLKNKSLIEKWNSSYFKKIRTKIANNKIESVCQSFCYNYQRNKNEPKIKEKNYINGINKKFIKNKIINTLEIINKKIILKSKPIEFSLSPTTICNYNCIMCPNTLQRQKGDLFEFDESFYSQLTELLPYLYVIHVSGQGEPFISKKFLKFLINTKWSYFPDVSFNITTNGSLLIPKLISSLSTVPIKYLIFSINSLNQKLYKKITGKNKFYQVLKNLEFININKNKLFSNNLYLQISFVVMKSNYNEIFEVIKFSKKNNIGFRLLPIEISDRNPQSFNESLIIPDNYNYYNNTLKIINTLINKYKNDDVVYHNLISFKSSLIQQFNNKETIINSYLKILKNEKRFKFI